MFYDTMKHDAFELSSCNKVEHQRKPLHEALASSSLTPAFHDLILNSLHKQIEHDYDDDDLSDDDILESSSTSLYYEEDEDDDYDDAEDESESGFIKYFALLLIGSFVWFGMQLFKYSTKVRLVYNSTATSNSDSNNISTMRQRREQQHTPSSTGGMNKSPSRVSRVSIQDVVQSTAEVNQTQQQHAKPWWCTMHIGLLMIWVVASAIARVR